jgi:hypothetical protein
LSRRFSGFVQKREFLTRHWDQIAATGFFTVEVWTRKGLRRFFVLFFIELSTRRVYVAGISARANGLWMNQIACNLTDAEDRLLQVKRYQIHTGSAVHRRISGDTDRSGRGVRPAAAPVAEPEQLRGTLRQKHQEIGSGTVDSVSEAFLRTAVRESSRITTRN